MFKIYVLTNQKGKRYYKLTYVRTFESTNKKVETFLTFDSIAIITIANIRPSDLDDLAEGVYDLFLDRLED